MAIGRISVALASNERAALIRMAELDCRDPRDLLRWLLIQEAQQRGLLPVPDGQERRLVINHYHFADGAPAASDIDALRSTEA